MYYKTLFIKVTKFYLICIVIQSSDSFLARRSDKSILAIILQKFEKYSTVSKLINIYFLNIYIELKTA